VKMDDALRARLVKVATTLEIAPAEAEEAAKKSRCSQTGAGALAFEAGWLRNTCHRAARELQELIASFG